MSFALPPEGPLTLALAAIAVAAALVSWGSWVRLARSRKPKYRGRHRH